MDQYQANGNASNGTGQPSAADGHVRKVKDTWRQFEDYGLAHRLQNEEFNQHFDQNRSERRLMHGDIHLSKEEQRLEDQYAAEYREQVRRDRERDDERVAMEMQRRLEMEAGANVNAKRAREIEDEMLARRLQDMEVTKTSTPSSNGSMAPVQVFAGPTNGVHRPTTHRHVSIPTDFYGQRIPPTNPDFHLDSRRNQTAAPMVQNSTSTSSNKKSPPPRPPPPRHNSLR